jgi:endonuclease YncB( thermonuclease family)
MLNPRNTHLEIPCIGDSEDAYGKTLAYVYLDTPKDGSYDHLFNRDLIELGFARTTTFSHTYRREFERELEKAKGDGTGLWGACLKVEGY